MKTLDIINTCKYSTFDYKTFVQHTTRGQGAAIWSSSQEPQSFGAREPLFGLAAKKPPSGSQLLGAEGLLWGEMMLLLRMELDRIPLLLLKPGDYGSLQATTLVLPLPATMPAIVEAARRGRGLQAS